MAEGSRPWRLLTWDTGEGLFPVDLYETDDEVVVKASLPGVKAEEVQISITGETLTIRGESKEEYEEKKPNFYRQERPKTIEVKAKGVIEGKTS